MRLNTFSHFLRDTSAAAASEVILAMVVTCAIGGIVAISATIGTSAPPLIEEVRVESDAAEGDFISFRD